MPLEKIRAAQCHKDKRPKAAWQGAMKSSVGSYKQWDCLYISFSKPILPYTAVNINLITNAREVQSRWVFLIEFPLVNGDYCFYCKTFAEYRVSTLHIIKVIPKRSVLVVVWNLRTIDNCVLEAKITLTFWQSGEGASDTCSCLKAAVMGRVGAQKRQHSW